MKLEWLLIVVSLSCLSMLGLMAATSNLLVAAQWSALLFASLSLLCGYMFFSKALTSWESIIVVMTGVSCSMVSWYLLSQIINVPSILLPFALSTFIVACIMSCLMLICALKMPAWQKWLRLPKK